ncbi:hypothetical protein Ahy_B05g075982 [Arachis hypogaea]|uniref:Uncharacterized protein n=1 Tax=Arachis hypogaea TaxID=3818 RepID=A0A444Z2C0_ARAHY|nr:hypothetical protein Ahy_B05g075982 [Arachis hypogaea]
MGRQLQQMLEDVHEKHDHLTTWLSLEIKKALYVYHETDKGFKHRRFTNKANRASAKSSKYTGDSATFMKTKARLSKLLDHNTTLVKTFKYTHILKENKERFADQQFTYHYVSKHLILSPIRRDRKPQLSNLTEVEDVSGSATSVVDPNAVWRKTALVPYKNCVYGLGLFFANNLRTSKLRPSSAFAPSQTVNPEEGFDLRLQAGVEGAVGAASADGAVCQAQMRDGGSGTSGGRGTTGGT